MMKFDLVWMLVTTCSTAVLFNNQSLRASNLKPLQIYTTIPFPHHLLTLLMCTLGAPNFDRDFDSEERVVRAYRNAYPMSSWLSHSSGRRSSAR